ncbi:HAD family phosphatase [Leucobacter allii]|uniref:HAD family phosphatase n=1 Tax=Leucobacter allii TaxID=2932247 RepID=A0ABY4FQ76_9MICO|nr:HAD family phosphatase [Leucobacter allii]UOQ58443.1 HAD family phosphatase [Leucobacter allii]UOR03024.1 HAD family phosphatase [Leucobacter allii]
MSASPTPRRPAAVLWDLDGTVIDSEPIWLEVELAMLGRYGIELTEELRAQLVGSGLRAAAERFRALGVPLSVDEIIAEWAAGVAAGMSRSAPLWRPGAVELLQSLAEAGIPSALVTMSVRAIADAVVALLPSGLFSAVVAGDEVEFEKPHPDPYLRGAALLGVDIVDCIAIEDSPTGLRAAAASGAVAIGVPNLVDLDGVAAHAHWTTLAGVDATALARSFAELRGVPPTPGAGTGALVPTGEQR